MIAVSLPDLAATEQLATALAPHLRVGDTVLLAGGVGAGKTTFTGYLVRTLGSSDVVRSPTYTVAHEYELPEGGRIAHLDLYRHEGALDAAAWGDLEPYFVDAIACIEWPGAISGWLTDRPTWRLELDPAGLDARVARLHPPDDRGAHGIDGSRIVTDIAAALGAPA